MHRTTLFATASTLAVAAFAAAPAHAQCAVTTGTGTAGSPNSGDTITCTDNLETDPILGPDATGVTLNVEAPAGGISVTGDGAVLLGDGAIIDIAAASNRPVQTSGDAATAIEVGNGAQITVGGRVATSGEQSVGILTGDGATVDVQGTVTTGGGNADAISIGADGAITVGPRANVNSQNSNSAAILLRGDRSSLTVEAEDTEMNGLQQGLVTTSSGNSNPVLIQGDDATVDVAGIVRSSSGDATAILAEGDGAEITVRDMGLVTATSSNSNAIESTGTGATIAVESGGEVVISSGNSAGVVSGAMATVEIGGTVSASSSQSQGIRLGDGSELTILAGGLIETSSSESQAVLVEEGAATATITVEEGGDIDAVGAQAIVDRGETETEVTVNGVVFGGSSDPVLDMGAGDDVVIVNGTVRGSSADPVIDMGAGDDEVEINSSTTVEGPGVLVAGGDGSDTLTLASGQEFNSSDFSGIETTNTRRNETMGDPNEGMNTSLNVDDDQRGSTVNAEDGGDVRVSDGGQAGDVNARDGGTATVESGGSAERVSADAGGRAEVQSGGRAGVDAGSGNGGTIDFRAGSQADVEGEARSDRQDIRVAGANFEDGTTVSVGNSEVLRGSAAGDTISLELDGDAFEQLGLNDNDRSFLSAVDGGIRDGDPDATAFITASAAEITQLIRENQGEGAARGAATGVSMARAFENLLGGRSAPRLGAVPALSFAPVTLSTQGLAPGRSEAWVSAYGGAIDDAGFHSNTFDASYAGLAVGVERAYAFGALGDGRIGLAIGAAEGEIDGFGGPDVDTLSIGLYADAVRGPQFVAGRLTYTSLDVENFGLDAGSGDIVTGRVEYAYNLRGDYHGPRLVAPYAALGFVSGDFDGRPTNVGVLSGGEIDQGLLEVGLRLGASYEIAGRPARGIVELGYERAFGDEDVVFSGTAFGNPFVTQAAANGDDRFKLGAGFTVQVSETATVDVTYEGRFSDSRDHRLGLGVGIRF